MGQKVHPTGFRLVVTRNWGSKWYADKDYAKLLHEDLRIRHFVKNFLANAGVSRIELEKAADKIKINIYTARPGVIIGKKGQEVDRLKREVQKLTEKQIHINIKEIRNSELDAQLVAENIALQLERRVAFRRAMRKSVMSAVRFGAKGIRVRCAGRLAGAEMGRIEWYLEGRVPLHTLRANIDYGFAEARTTYGVIGVKVWLYKGEAEEKRVRRPSPAARDFFTPGKRPSGAEEQSSKRPRRRIRRKAQRPATEEQPVAAETAEPTEEPAPKTPTEKLPVVEKAGKPAAKGTEASVPAAEPKPKRTKKSDKADKAADPTEASDFDADALVGKIAAEAVEESAKKPAEDDQQSKDDQQKTGEDGEG